MSGMRELVVAWSHFLVLVVVPAALVGALLRRINRQMPAVLAIALAAEALTLTPAALDLVRLDWAPVLDLVEQGWKAELVHGLLLLHLYFFVPILVAVFIGYAGWGYIPARHRTN
jgi:multidrug efflux pump subunit AcrB